MRTSVISSARRAERGRLSRRVFVRAVGGAAVAVGLPGWIACSGDDAAPGGAAGSLDAGAGSSACRSFLTPAPEFFQQFGGASSVEGWQLPELDAGAHRLEIGGLVDTPLSLSLAELEADTAQHVTVLNSMMCVLGFRDTAIWTGVPLSVLLDRAGIDRGAAVRVRFFGADGFDNNLRVEDIYEGPADIFEPLIAFRLYGERLPQALGFPMRLLLADRYGYKNTKWLQRIEVSDVDEATGQYQARGYDDAGVIEPVPTVENRRIMETVTAGSVELCGIALSGLGGVDVVEVSLDGADHEPAELAPLPELLARHPELAQTLQLADATRFGWPARGVWSLWQATLELSPGQHTIDVRVRDQSGAAAEGATLRFVAEA